MAHASEVTVAIVGFGWFGKQHLRAWRAVPGARVVALCDPSEAAFDAHARHGQDAFHEDVRSGSHECWHGIPRFASLERMLAETDVDIVDVVTPEADHAEVAATALEHGCSVIVEKPLATSASAALRLAQLAQRAGRRLFAAHVLRFDARYAAAFGTASRWPEPPLHIASQRHFQAAALDVYGRVDAFFGACIHDIDLAIWGHGRAPDRVLGFRTLDEAGRTRTAGGVLEWMGAGTACIQNCWALAAGAPAGFMFETTAFLPDRTVTIRNTPLVEIVGSDRATWPELFLWPERDGVVGGALADELAHFAACERGGCASPRMPPEQAVAGVLTAAALARSAETGAWTTPDAG